MFSFAFTSEVVILTAAISSTSAYAITQNSYRLGVTFICSYLTSVLLIIATTSFFYPEKDLAKTLTSTS